MSTTYSIPRDSIISAALRKLGVLELGTTPDTNTITNAAQSLNVMMKAWQSQGIKLWSVEEYPITLTANKKDYTIGNLANPTVGSILGTTVTQGVITNAGSGGTPGTYSFVSGGNVSAITMGSAGTSGNSSLIWTNASTTVNALAIATNGTTLLAGGTSGQVAISTNSGVSWSSVTTGLPGYAITGIAWNGTVFCLVGLAGIVATSPTGASGTWTQRTIPVDNYVNVVFGNGLFITYTSTPNGPIYTSPDGINWSPVTMSGLGSTSIGGVCWGNGQWVITTYYITYNPNSPTNTYTSSDGANWTQHTNVMPAPGIGIVPEWTQVASNGSIYVAAGAQGNYSATSPDGITWTLRSSPTYPGNNNQGPYLVSSGNTFLLSGGGNAGYTSTNGITWTSTPIAGATGLYAVCSLGSNNFAAAGPSSASTARVGYASAGTYPLTFTSIAGSGATGTYTISSSTGQITSTSITNGGAGYTSSPTVSFLYGGISAATATTTIIPLNQIQGTYTIGVSGTLTSVNITNTGTGLTTSPTITFPNGGIVGAVATAPLTTIDITNDKPLKIIQGWLRNTTVTPNIDTPVQILSRQEYNLLGSKYAPGMINSVWYDPNTTYGTLHTYLTPDTFTASTYTLILVGQRPLEEVSLSTDIPDFPNEWMQALIWGLADELAIEYGLPGNHRQEITMKAEKYRKDLEDWDVETTSTMFTPDMRMVGNRTV